MKKLKDILNEVLQEAKLTNRDANKVKTLFGRTSSIKSIENVVVHKDALMVSYTNYKERGKIIKAVSRLYKYDADGRSTNAPKAIGIAGYNWIAFVNESVNEVESEDDTEFTVKLSHLLKKHVTKGGEIEEAIDTHIPQFADDKKYIAEFRKKYGVQETNKFLSFEIEPLAGSGHFNYKDIANLAKKNTFGIWDTVRLVNKAYVNQVKGVPMNVKNESTLKEMDINDPILVSIRAKQTALKKKAALPKVKKISMKQYYKLLDTQSDLIDQMKAAAKDYERLDSEMNQAAGQKGANWSDADANSYGGDLNKLQTKIEKLAKQKYSVRKAIMNYRMS